MASEIAVQRGKHFMGNYPFSVLHKHFLPQNLRIWTPVFKFKRKTSLQNSFDLLFGTTNTLSNDFKALGFSDKITSLMASEKLGKKNCFKTFFFGGGVWFYRTYVFISFNFQISRICLTPRTCVELEYQGERQFLDSSKPFLVQWLRQRGKTQQLI